MVCGLGCYRYQPIVSLLPCNITGWTVGPSGLYHTTGDISKLQCWALAINQVRSGLGANSVGRRRELMFVIEWRLNQNEQNDKTNWNVCVFCTPNFFSSCIFWVWIFQKHTKVRLCVEKTSSQSPSARPCINIALEFMPLPMMMVPWVQAFVDMTWHNFQWGQREKQKLETTNKVYEWGSLNSNNDKENVDWWHLVLANDNNICPNKVKIYVRVLWYIKNIIPVITQISIYISPRWVQGVWSPCLWVFHGVVGTPRSRPYAMLLWSKPRMDVLMMKWVLAPPKKNMYRYIYMFTEMHHRFSLTSNFCWGDKGWVFLAYQF